MFGEDGFGVLAFADIVILIGVVSYSPTRMETRVTLISPSGKVITTVPSFKLVTEVSLLYPNKMVVVVPQFKLKTNVTILSPVSVVVSAPAQKISTKTEILAPNKGKIVVSAPAFKIITKVTPMTAGTITSAQLTPKVQTNVQTGVGHTSIGLRVGVS